MLRPSTGRIWRPAEGGRQALDHFSGCWTLRSPHKQSPMAPAHAAGARCQAGCSSSFASNPGPPLRQFSGLRAGAPIRQAAALQAAAPQRSRARGCQALVTARAGAVGIGLWGTKAGMTQIFTADGLALPATVIALEPGNIVTQVKTAATDGYSAVQVGYRVVPERKITRPQAGHLKKSGVEPMRKLREFRVRVRSRQSPRSGVWREQHVRMKWPEQFRTPPWCATEARGCACSWTLWTALSRGSSSRRTRCSRSVTWWTWRAPASARGSRVRLRFRTLQRWNVAPAGQFQGVEEGAALR